MRLTHFFVDRPIFAGVISVIFVILGAVAFARLPVAQYPEIAPPVISVNAQFPGASAETVAQTVASVLEQEINGVEGMIYMSSNSTEDGRLGISISFDLGTNLDQAQVEVQNRVRLAEPRLPEEVRRLGVTVRKNSPDLMMVVHLYSPDASRDGVFISNFANSEVKDVLSRLKGVGSIMVFGGRDYAMRIWLDPDRMAARSLTAAEVVAALQRQNIQVASGVLNAPPVPTQAPFQVAVLTKGRLAEPDEFARTVVKSTGGVTVRLMDVARVELAAQDYSTNAYLDGHSAVALGVFQRPGSNALQAAEEVQSTMAEVSKRFPQGLTYAIAYNPTEFIAQSVDAVVKTILEASALVVVVILLFLQSWRAAIIPIIAIPVSLIGTFFMMAMFGFSLNNLTLFGLVLAIGIVVDDAIVVVENVERNIALGMTPREAAHKTMDEVAAALIAIALVLAAVFVPAGFVTGISGQFYRQFALTIAGSTAISCIFSLTLSPALCALLLKPHHVDKPNPLALPFRKFFNGFNDGFEKLSRGYGWVAGKSVRYALLVLVGYGALLGLGAKEFGATPKGFIPPQDRGYLIVAVQLPSGAALERTDAVIREAVARILTQPGVNRAAAFAGFSGATFTNAPNSGAIFVTLKPYTERAPLGLSGTAIQGALFGKLASIQEAFLVVLSPPPVQGIGNAGGFRMMIQDRGGQGTNALSGAVMQMMIRGAQTPGVSQVFSFFENRTPQLFLDIDRVKVQQLGVSITDVFRTLEVQLGSAYVNDFNMLGRTFRVVAQADAPYRMEADDILRLRVRNATGDTVPFGSFATVRNEAGAARVPRYNLYPAAELDGQAAPGISQGEAMKVMEKLAAEVLPEGFGYEWTGIAYQQMKAGDTASFVFVLAVVFVFLVLAAQFESLTMPLAVILIVPMCLVAGISGVLLRGQDNNILTQVGFVVLVGLAAKNAILIVEFAKQLEGLGRSARDAAVEAARLRLRPILMTSLAFVLGVVPLVIATGAGAEMRQALGTVVFAGMIGVTLFGLLFTPAFYVITQWLGGGWKRRSD